MKRTGFENMEMYEVCSFCLFFPLTIIFRQLESLKPRAIADKGSISFSLFRADSEESSSDLLRSE